MSEKVEEIKPYGSGEKGEEVEEMFDSIAPHYDLMNRVMSLGMHLHWRDKALDKASSMLKENGHCVTDILDVATGTGDVAFELLRRFPEGNVCGLDLSAGMMKVAADKATKLSKAQQKRVRFVQGDSLNLPFKNNSFDLVTVAYGVRNFSDIRKGMTEMARVLRPGGVLCIIELSEPANKLIRLPYRLYSRMLIPIVGRIVSGDSRAYAYLPESIAAVPQRSNMTRLMEEAGLSECGWESLTLGVLTIYYSRKSSDDERKFYGEERF